MRAVEACLLSVNVPDARELAAEAIDALERVVAGAYRPGEGMSHRVGAAPFVRGGLTDQVQVGFDSADGVHADGPAPVCDARRRVDAAGRRTRPSGERDAPFAVTCEVARVFCRLAALHHDDEYRRTAVLAVDTDYVREATRTLDALAPSVRERGVEAAPFGLALAEWLDLQ